MQKDLPGKTSTRVGPMSAMFGDATDDIMFDSAPDVPGEIARMASNTVVSNSRRCFGAPETPNSSRPGVSYGRGPVVATLRAQDNLVEYMSTTT